MHRQIAGKLTGRVTKWIVLAASILLIGVLGYLGAKLADVQNNEAVLLAARRRAESTQVARRALAGPSDPNDIPTLVVYHRDGGLTEADLAAIEDQGAEIAAIDGVGDDRAVTPGVRPRLPRLRGRRGRLHLLHLQLRQGRLERHARRRRRARATSPRSTASTVHLAGYGGQAADSAEAFERHRHHPAPDHPAAS